MHPTWGKSGLQTHEDTETDPDERQELHPGRKEEMLSMRFPARSVTFHTLVKLSAP